MSERYIKRFVLPTQKNQDDLKWPVSIEAGALLQDNQLGRVLAQVKYKNTSPKSIKAITVNVAAYDASGAAIEGLTAFVYDRLMASSGEFFGDKIPVIMPDNNTYSYRIEVVAVAFSDGTSWSRFRETAAQAAKVVGQESAKAAKVIGKEAVKVSKTAGSVVALIVNILITVVMAIATLSIIVTFSATPVDIIALIALTLATIVSIPGLGRVILKERYGAKARVLRWVIFVAIMVIAKIVAWIIL